MPPIVVVSPVPVVIVVPPIPVIPLVPVEIVVPPIAAVPPVPVVTVVPPIAVALPQYAGDCLAQGLVLGRYLPYQYGNLSFFANTSYLAVSAAEGGQLHKKLRLGDCN